MELTTYASWLNSVFGLFDTFLLGICHELAVEFGDILTPIANILDVAGHWGAMFIALAVMLMCFRKTRMAGFAMIVAIGIAGGFAEFLVKDIVARPRPFVSSELFASWWQFVGSPDVHGSSFPSGHVTGATAAMIALAYGVRRWWASLLGVIMIALMALDRMYLQVHYPSDVIAGFILGFIAGIVGYAIVQGIWRLLGKHPDQIAEEQYHAALTKQQPFIIPRKENVSYANMRLTPDATQPGTSRMTPSPADPLPPARSGMPTERYMRNTVTQTIQTNEGSRVVVPPMPSVEELAHAQTPSNMTPSGMSVSPSKMNSPQSRRP